MISKAKTHKKTPAHKKTPEGVPLLIKLWIGIIIAGILAAVLIPSVMNEYKTAVDSRVQADIKEIAGEIEKLAFMDYSNAPLSFEGGVEITDELRYWPTIVLLDPESGYPIGSASVRVNTNRTTFTVEGTTGEYTITGTDPGGKVAADDGYVYNSNLGIVFNQRTGERP